MALSVTTSVSVAAAAVAVRSRSSSVFEEWKLPIERLSQAACEFQHFIRASFSRSHQCAADDDSIGELANRLRLGGRRNPKTHANRKRRRRAQTGNRLRQRRVRRFLNSGDAEPADKINES